MRRLRLLLFICCGSACVALASDPAERWLHKDAPRAYLVRQSDTEAGVIARFVTQAHHWKRVWCPYPDADATIEAGDLLVRVRIDGRSWVQRARRGNGTRSHVRELNRFKIEAGEPFVFVPRPEIHPVQQIPIDDPRALVIHEPAQAISGQVLEIWPKTEGQPATLIRVDRGTHQHLKPGTALTVVPREALDDPRSWMRAVVVAAWPGYSYALMIDSEVAPEAGNIVRSLTAWCVIR